MSAMKIHGSEQTINKVFSDDFAFEIPHYQRPYSWTLEQAGELLDDLLASLGKDETPIEEITPYFLGCIVLIKQEPAPDAKVVDGQQRLTTLTVLLAVLRHCIEDRGSAEDLTPFLYAKGNRMLGTSNRYRLLVRDRDRAFFHEYVHERGGLDKLMTVDAKRLESISQLNLSGNSVFLMAKVQQLPNALRQRLAMFLLSRCVLVVVSSPDLDSAYRIFSILNNRGLDLSHGDILKAEIIGKLPAAISEDYSEKWEDAESTLGADGFKDLFAHIRMIYRKQKMRETVLKEFRDHVVPMHPAKELIDGVILPLADAYQDIKGATFESSRRAEEVNSLFRWLNQIDNFDWVPPAIQYLKDHRDDPDALVRFFADLERLATYMMICRVDITKRIDRYGRVLTAMGDKVDLYAPGSPLQLSDEERAATVKVLDGDLYPIKNVPKYVLLRLDTLLSDGEAKYDLDVVSIEHVLPRTPDAASEWCRNFPEPTRRNATVHRLGNLVLLSHRKNSSALNYDFDKKKTKYFLGKGKVSPFALTTQVLNEKVWTPEVVERRQKDLLGRLKGLWRL
jgi:hypothetical protein